jgi:hypothetical protein
VLFFYEDTAADNCDSDGHLVGCNENRMRVGGIEDVGSTRSCPLYCIYCCTKSYPVEMYCTGSHL